jgi:hypothetical protein
MIGEPRLEDRAEQHYVGIRTQVPMKAFNSRFAYFYGGCEESPQSFV